MLVARTRAELDNALSALRGSGSTLGFVPTMGALHDGHLGLIDLSGTHADQTCVSIFVNPTQFAPNEDFDAYPRDEEEDLAKLKDAGCALAYLPDPDEMYPEGEDTRVVPGALAAPLEGASRPGFFTGVCTVVTKLFAHVQPDTAVFGEKDYQQLLIVRRLTRDLGLRIEIIGAPIARAADGLALSSRNRYLSDDDRRTAVAIPQTLAKIAARVRGGVAVDTALIQGLSDLSAAGLTPDYLDMRGAEDLRSAPARVLRPSEADTMRLFLAATVGGTRLIDNAPV